MIWLLSLTAFTLLIIAGVNICIEAFKEKDRRNLADIEWIAQKTHLGRRFIND